MKALSYIFKVILWSLSVSVVIRIVFGMYSIFGAPVLLIPVVMGIGAASSLAPANSAGYVTVSTLHIILITGFSVLSDVTGIFRRLASDSADFFAKTVSTGDAGVNILWCILFVMPVYFLSYVLFAGIISYARARKLRIISEAEELPEDEYEDHAEIRRSRR